MRKYFSILPIFIILLFTVPAIARDFTLDDFDYPDPVQVDIYSQAIDTLLEELTIYGTDSDGNDVFSAVPMTMELVTLQTQLRIHESGADPGTSFTDILIQANNDKPSANAFAFILDGDPLWVRRSVTLYIYPSDDLAEPIMMPVVMIADPEIVEGGDMIQGWAFMAEDEDQLHDFLTAKEVKIVVGEGEEGIEPISLDCGFWRRYGLFDIGDESIVVEQPAPEGQ
jgi:hypothetical protein